MPHLVGREVSAVAEIEKPPTRWTVKRHTPGMVRA
jgi:hypothetical protein